MAPRHRWLQCSGWTRRWRPAGALPRGTPPRACRRVEIRFRDVTFAYPGGAAVLEGFDLTIPAGSSLAIVGQNGAGKTTLAKLLCRLYDPQTGCRSRSTESICASSICRRGGRG